MEHMKMAVMGHPRLTAIIAVCAALAFLRVIVNVVAIYINFVVADLIVIGDPKETAASVQAYGGAAQAVFAVVATVATIAAAIMAWRAWRMSQEHLVVAKSQRYDALMPVLSSHLIDTEDDRPQPYRFGLCVKNVGLGPSLAARIEATADSPGFDYVQDNSRNSPPREVMIGVNEEHVFRMVERSVLNWEVAARNSAASAPRPDGPVANADRRGLEVAKARVIASIHEVTITVSYESVYLRRFRLRTGVWKHVGSGASGHFEMVLNKHADEHVILDDVIKTPTDATSATQAAGS